MVRIVLGENLFETDLAPTPELDHWFHLWLVAQDAIPAQQTQLHDLTNRLKVSTNVLHAAVAVLGGSNA